jgi:PAS domain S-box-containing protein
MLFLYTSIAYSLITLLLALVILFRTRKSFQSKFYLLCVSLLIFYSIAGTLASLPEYQKYRDYLETATIFFFSVLPFFFLHFIIIYTGQGKLHWKKYVVLGIYFAGLFAYTMILVGLIPNPIGQYKILSEGGYLFFFTWMSVFFSIGVSELIFIYGGFHTDAVKSRMFFSSFAILVLILPGPFSESVLKVIFGQSRALYSIISTVALILSVYLIFRNKLVVTFYDALRSTIGVMKEIIIRTDDKFNIVVAQGAVKHNFGFEEKDLLGKKLTSFFADANEPIYQSASWIERKMHDGLISVDIINADKKVIPMSFSFTPLFNDDIIVGYIGIGRNALEQKVYEQSLLDSKINLEYLVEQRTAELQKLNQQLQEDVSKRKKAEEELRVLNQELRNVGSSKDKFFTIVAHDLKAPFQGLLGYSKLIVDDLESLTPAEIREYSNNIHYIGKNLYDMVENLLYWARVQIGKTDFQPVEMDLSEIVNDVINTLGYNAVRKDIVLKTDIKTGLKVFVDHKMIYSVLQNLISNAIKFTRADGIITVSASILIDALEVSVTDTGIGIEPENIVKLFNIDTPFKSEGTANEEGTGLGLILCKELLEKHKGTIRVESEIGKGSSFIVTLPNRN